MTVHLVVQIHPGLSDGCPHVQHADMMKLVDISDLGSDDHVSWGFKSLYPYIVHMFLAPVHRVCSSMVEH